MRQKKSKLSQYIKIIDSLHWKEELNIVLKNKYYIVIIHSSSMNKTSFVPENSSRNHKKNSNSDLTQLQSAHFIYPSILHLITPTRIVTKMFEIHTFTTIIKTNPIEIK